MADLVKSMAGRKGRTPQLTLVETITRGLMSDPKANKARFKIKYDEGKGRGVYLGIPLLKKYSFVLEYEGDLISESEAASREQVYEHNLEGCYIMSFVYKGEKMAIDATRHFDSYTRLLNHSRHPNIKFFKPLVVDLVNGKPRIGAYALRDIAMGEELVFDYGVRDGDIPWLRNKKAGFYSPVDSSTDEEDEVLSPDSRIMMRLSSPKKRNISPKVCSEPIEIKPVENFKPSQSNSTSSQQQTNSVTVSEPSTSNFTQIKRHRKNDVMFSSIIVDHRSICGFKFTKVTGHNYMRGLQPIGCPQKILRSLEEGPKKRRTKLTEEENTACISVSDESMVSKQDHSVSEISSSPGSQPIESAHSGYSSTNKVLNWLPCIEKVQSLSEVADLTDSSKGEDTIEIDDSSEEENLSKSAPVQNFPDVHKNQDPAQGKKIARKSSPDVLVISDDESSTTLPQRSDDDFSYTLPSQMPSRKLSSTFSSVPAPTQIAIIKPYFTPERNNRNSILILDSPQSSSLGSNGSTGTGNLTQDELKSLEKMFKNYMFSRNYQEDIYSTIEKNWLFFKTLTERGVSVEEIRQAVRNIFAVRPPNQESNQESI